MKATTDEVTTRVELDAENKKDVQTSKQLKQRRFEIDNRDIRVKTVSGQAKTSAKIAIRDANERYRAPETASIYDL